MLTIKSGVYSFTTVNHRGSYAALSVSSAKVVRFSSQTSFYDSTSSAIIVHRRSSDSIAPSSARGDVKYTNSVSGKIVIDRTYAADYLASVGYSSEAIARIG